MRRRRLTGKPVAVMVSAKTSDKLQAVQRAAPQKAVDDGMVDIKAGNIVDGDEVFSRLRKQVLDAANEVFAPRTGGFGSH